MHTHDAQDVCLFVVNILKLSSTAKTHHITFFSQSALSIALLVWFQELLKTTGTSLL